MERMILWALVGMLVVVADGDMEAMGATGITKALERSPPAMVMMAIAMEEAEEAEGMPAALQDMMSPEVMVVMVVLDY